jgi:thiol-disulfide isomerase/thioredoxin
MRLDRDEFAITYDPAKVAPAEIIATIRETGYTARVVSGDGKSLREPVVSSLPLGFAPLDEALAQARRERKPVVLDFFAEWCAPCVRMEKTTFKDERVKALLGRCVFVRVDTDKQADIAKRMAVEGLPDIRFALPDGRVISLSVPNSKSYSGRWRTNRYRGSLNLEEESVARFRKALEARDFITAL